MNKKIRIILFILIIATVISTASYCSAPYDTEASRVITVRNSFTGSGFILRQETPVEFTQGGVFEPSVKEGTRVSKGSPLGILITGDIDPELVSELEEITQRINEIKQADGISDIYSSDEARIFSAMKSLTAQIRQNTVDGNFIDASECIFSLATLIEKKHSIDNGSAADQLLVSLEAEKYNLEQQIGGVRQEIYAPASGYYYAGIDGLEKNITEEELLLLTNSDIDDYSKSYKNSKNPILASGKIVDTYTWYLAASVPNEEAQALSVGDIVTISVDESSFVSATVIAINSDTTEKSAIVLKSDKNIPGIFEKRTARFEVCLAEHTGLYVPSAAVRVKDGITGVYVMNTGNNTTFKCINILYESDEYLIVENNYIPPEDVPYSSLKTHDNILVNPEVSRIDS